MIDEDKMEYLFESLKDKDPHVRVFTINSIVDNKNRDLAVPELIKLLFDDSPVVRSRAAWALGKIKDLTAFDNLIQALNDEEGDVRKNVIRSLGEMMAFDAIPYLVSMFEDESWEVRAEVAVVLEYIGWNPKNREEQTYQLFARGKWEELEKLENMNAEILLKFLKDDDRETRSKIAWLLGEIGEKKYTQSLFDLFMTDGFQDVKENSSIALGKIGGKKALDLLLVSLHDEDWYVRKCAATALGYIKERTSIPALQSLVKDDNTFVSRSAEEALKRIEENSN